MVDDDDNNDDDLDFKSSSSAPSILQLGRPPLRLWELNDNSTRYDRLVAAPSDDDLRLMWILWATLASVVTIFVLTEFLAILFSPVPSTRRNPFNVYLLYLMVPDLWFAAACAVTCVINAHVGHFFSPGLCRFQSFYVVWAVTANSWLNAAIARQLHTMLSSSNLRMRYHVPTRWRVTYEALTVYGLATFVASWIFVPSQWLPHRTAAISGQACIPVEYSRASSIFFFVVYVPFMTLIPLVYTGWVGFDIWYHGLMPPVGRRRLLARYFMRIIAVFVTMWLPFIVLVYVVAGNFWLEPWVLWIGGAFGHLQAACSAAMSLLKPDVAQAFRDFLQCRTVCCRRVIPSRLLSVLQQRQPTEQALSSLNDMSALHNTTIPEQNDDFCYDDELLVDVVDVDVDIEQAPPPPSPPQQQQPENEQQQQQQGAGPSVPSTAAKEKLQQQDEKHASVPYIEKASTAASSNE